MDVFCTVDDRPIRLIDWTADATVNWGNRNFTGYVPLACTWAEQEAPVSLWLPDGTELWSGKLALDPVIENGRLRIRGEGWAENIAVPVRLFYRIDGAEGFAPSEADPFNHQHSELIDADARDSRLVYIGTQDELYASSARSGLALWVKGGLITRVRYVFHKTTIMSDNFDIRTNRFTGPTGAQTTEDDLPCSSTADDSTNVFDITTPEDAIEIQLRCNTGFTPNNRHKYWLTDIRVYGRTTDDAFTASQVFSDVGSLAGLDTSGVGDNLLPVLPIDWTAEPTDLLTYIAELTDWHWEVSSMTAQRIPILSFAPWEEEVTVSQAVGATPVWETEERWKGVRVPYERLSGGRHVAEVTADPDPFPDSDGPYFEADALADPQPDDTLAEARATVLAPYYASRRASGRLTIGKGRIGPFPVSGYHVRPGMLARVIERDDLDPQRIVGVTYRPGGEAIADITNDFSVPRLLRDIRGVRPATKPRTAARNYAARGRGRGRG